MARHITGPPSTQGRVAYSGNYHPPRQAAGSMISVPEIKQQQVNLRHQRRQPSTEKQPEQASSDLASLGQLMADQQGKKTIDDKAGADCQDADQQNHEPAAPAARAAITGRTEFTGKKEADRHEQHPGPPEQFSHPQERIARSIHKAPEANSHTPLVPPESAHQDSGGTSHARPYRQRASRSIPLWKCAIISLTSTESQP